jgi:hypothetical protein
MGGDDSQNLLPWRGIYSSPGRSQPLATAVSTTRLSDHSLRHAPQPVLIPRTIEGNCLTGHAQSFPRHRALETHGYFRTCLPRQPEAEDNSTR